MSQFTEVSRAGYEAISRDDVDAFLALTDPDVEFNSLIEGRTYRGHDGVREWWKNVINALVGVGLDLDEVFDFEDHGYVKMVIEDPGESNLPPAIWQAVRIKDGKAVWWGIFPSDKQARKALGLKKKKG
jgi:hypothetical protein